MLRSNGSLPPLWAKLQQSVARQHAVGIAGERLQEVELHGGDRHLAAVQREQSARIEVEDVMAKADLATVTRGLIDRSRPYPPQHAPNPGQGQAQR